MQLSKLESQLCTELQDRQLLVFQAKDAQLLLELSSTQAYNLLKALKRKKAIQKAGKYFILTGTDELVAATSLHFPSYLSFWSALSYYGFTDQLPKTIFIASSRYHSKMKSFHYVTLSRSRFFGYQLLGKIVIAEKEKAFLDALLFPKYAGGIKEIWKCLLAAQQQIKISTLIHYALKMNSKILLRRVGFLLEHLGLPKNKLLPLRKRMGQGYEKLDPSLPRKNNWNAHWLLDVNVNDFNR